MENKLTTHQYRKIAIVAAEMNVIKAQLDALFIKCNSDGELPEEVVDEVFKTTFPVNSAVHSLNEIVEEGGDIYNDVK